MANDQEKQQEQNIERQIEQNIEQDSENGQRFITDIEDEEQKKKRKQKEAEEEKARQRAMKRKLIPPFVMLLAGAIVSISLWCMQYQLKDMLIILLCVLLGFYFAGSVIKWMLDQFEAQIEKERMEDGKIIEKDLEAEDGTENVQRGTSAETEEDGPDTEESEEA